MTKKTICVDFDGVLNEYDGYEEGDLGEPLTGSKEFIKELRRKYKVVILTSRSKEQVIHWLSNNGFPSMKVTNRKVPAVAYIDDRAIQFNGSYKKVISRLKYFKPCWAKEYYRVYNIVTDETIALFNDIYDATRVCNSYQSQDVRIQRIPGELE